MRAFTRWSATFALVAGLCLLYADPLLAMVRQWNISPMYSYAFTVPAISAFLLWSRRREFQQQPLRPAPMAGGLVLLAALAMLALGHLAAVQIVEQLSFLVALTALVLFLFGRERLKIAAPGLFYLLFMVPFWDALTESLHTPFQNNSAQLGVTILHAVGIPAHRDGTIIALPNITLEVARACSGVNYLIAVLALAIPLSILRLHTWTRRLLLVGAAVVISALANGLRVALIGVLAYLEIGSPLHGPFHVLHGLFVAGVGYVVLFVGLRLMERPSTVTDDPKPSTPVETLRPASFQMHAWGLAVILWTLAFVGVGPKSDPVALAMPLERLPTVLGRWSVDGLYRTSPEPSGMWTGATERLRRGYFRPDGRTAFVEIWYFDSQNQSREIVDFNSTDLHRRATTRQLVLRDNQAFAVNVIRWPDQVGLFWYEFNGTTEHDPYAAKWLSLWTAVTAGRSNGAAVMLRAPARGSDESPAPLDELAVEIHHALVKHWQTGTAAQAASSTPHEVNN